MKRHRTDAVSLIFGLAFLMIAAWWALSRQFDLNLPVLGWLAAVGLIVLGALGLIGAVRGAREDSADAEAEQEPRL